MATRSGTWAYRDDHDGFARTYFRRFGDAVVSSVGVGTYLGAPTDERDAGYRDAVERALASGCNLFDTAINYRHQRSERALGEALDRSAVDRERVVIATKGGFLPFDGERPDDPGAWLASEWIDGRSIDPGAVVQGRHCIAPAALDAQLDRSLENLGLDTVDCYYVHNPETQLAAVDRETVYDRLEAAFERLEERAAAGDLRHYGVATWTAFRVPRDHGEYLSLPEVCRRARRAADRVGNAGTHFRAVQLPFNVEMADAFRVRAHEGPDGEDLSALAFAADAGLDVFASASLCQGDLLAGLPAAVAERVAGDTPAQQAINFARSAPAVTAALVGTGTPAHVDENVGAGRHAPLGAAAFDAVFE